MIKDVVSEVREGREALRGTPWGKIAFGVVGACVMLIVVSRSLSLFSEVGAVAQAEIGPAALLAKYTWLKDAHAQLDKKGADIAVYKASLASMASAYEGKPRTVWAREDRDAYNQRATEVAGTVATFNDLAAQYNAKMSEVQWAFTNVGSLPKGAETPLPREYAPYKTE